MKLLNHSIKARVFWLLASFFALLIAAPVPVLHAQAPPLIDRELFFGDPEIAVVVEWSDIVADVLPEERLTVRLIADEESESERRVEFTCPTSLAYLIGDIT